MWKNAKLALSGMIRQKSAIVARQLALNVLIYTTIAQFAMFSRIYIAVIMRTQKHTFAVRVGWIIFTPVPLEIVWNVNPIVKPALLPQIALFVTLFTSKTISITPANIAILTVLIASH